MPKLISKSPEFEGKVFDLSGDVVTVGRSDDNQIQITHPSISSNHAELRESSGDYQLVDLGSTNGSRVNDEKTEEAVLRNGDVVMLGNILFSYESEVTIEAAPLPDAETRVDLTASSGAGRPTEFKNLAPIKKVKNSGGGFPLPILLALLFALAGVGYLAYVVFLG
jgi:pSer/pThr/pTyr-binding forkhead associated (FHA) protein